MGKVYQDIKKSQLAEFRSINFRKKTIPAKKGNPSNSRSVRKRRKSEKEKPDFISRLNAQMDGEVRRKFAWFYKEFTRGERFGLFTEGEITRMTIRTGVVLAELEGEILQGSADSQLSLDVDLCRSVKEHFQGLLQERAENGLGGKIDIE